MKQSAIRFAAAVFAFAASGAAAPAQSPGRGDGTTGQPETMPWLKWDRATGAWWGNRPVFADRGFEFTATYTAEVWGVVAGGIERNAAYFGLLQFGLDADLEKIFGWKGGSFNTTWVWTSGDQPAAQFVGSNFAVSGIEAERGLRCLDLWVQQQLFGETLTLRAGMFNADRDFTVSEYASLFANSGFGWPVLYEGSLSGPPAYPYAAPGLYAAYRPDDAWVFKSAVMQGETYPQDGNFHWNLNRMDGLLFLNEASYAWSEARLPGTAKLGAIFSTGYPDTPDGSGGEAWGGAFYYGMVDQSLSSEPGSTETCPQGLGCFVRGGFAAPQRSNPPGMLLQTGFVYTGLIPRRDNDSLGVAFCWDQSSPQSAATLEGGNRGLEMIFEVTYQIQVASWFAVQPDLQYIVQPGGGTAIPNALVLGLSVSVDF